MGDRRIIRPGAEADRGGASGRSGEGGGPHAPGDQHRLHHRHLRCDQGQPLDHIRAEEHRAAGGRGERQAGRDSQRAGRRAQRCHRRGEHHGDLARQYDPNSQRHADHHGQHSLRIADRLRRDLKSGRSGHHGDLHAARDQHGQHRRQLRRGSRGLRMVDQRDPDDGRAAVTRRERQRRGESDDSFWREQGRQGHGGSRGNLARSCY